MANGAFKQILIFTDGACSGNPGKGGYGTIIVYPEGRVEELGFGFKETTNNKMELQAVIEGLKAIKEIEGEVWVLTDSTYVIHGITKWIWGWKKRDWVNAEGNEVANQNEWKKLDRLVHDRKKKGKIEWKYVRGHSGTPGNERADEIAVGFTQGKYVDLFEGKLLEYSIAIHDLPDDMSVPEMRTPGEKPKPISYLSYVNGEFQRHGSWKECEAAVKGRKGARFKKAHTNQEEAEIVKSWGLDPKKVL